MLKHSLTLLLTLALYAQAQGSVSGTISAPAGMDVRGTYVIVCIPTSEGCDESQPNDLQTVGADGRFSTVPLPANDYVVIAWKDINGNGSIDDGDYVALYSINGEFDTVRPPAQSITLTLSISGVSAPATLSGGMDNALLGRWQRGTISGVDFYSPVTGSWAPPSGSGGSWEFLPDGTYVNAAMGQSSLYSCTMTLFGYRVGTYTVQDDVLMLQQTTNKFKSSDNCNAQYNYERDDPLETQYYLYRIVPDGSGWQLELTRLVMNAQGQLDFEPDGSTDVYYFDN